MVGHVLRHEVLLRDIIDGRMKGNATRVRKRLDMLSDFKTTIGYMEVESCRRVGSVECKEMKEAKDLLLCNS